MSDLQCKTITPRSYGYDCTQADGSVTPIRVDGAGATATSPLPLVTVGSCVADGPNHAQCVTSTGQPVDVTTDTNGDVLYVDSQTADKSGWTRQCTQKGFVDHANRTFGQAQKFGAAALVPATCTPVRVSVAAGTTALQAQQDAGQKARVATLLRGAANSKNFTVLEKDGSIVIQQPIGGSDHEILRITKSGDGLTVGIGAEKIYFGNADAKSLLALVTGMVPHAKKPPAPTVKELLRQLFKALAEKKVS